MREDPRGIALTTDAPASVAALEAVIEGLLLHRADVGPRFVELLRIDPDLVLGRAAYGLALALLGRREKTVAARAQLARAKTALEARGGTARERALVAGLDAWLAGEPARGAAEIDAILDDEPLDALVAKLAHACWFVLGRSRRMRRVTERTLPAWDASIPGYGPLLGCHGFALEETGSYREAERAARAAVEMNAADIWAGHGVAHVMEMEGRVAEGASWLRALEPHHRDANNLRFHVAWHEALFSLAMGDVAGVLALYDRRVRAEPTDDYRDVSNATTLLWRLERLGVDVGDRWEELADIARARAADGTLAFAVAHYGMALVGAGRDEGVSALLSGALRDAVGTQASLIDEVALPLTRAMHAVRRGDAARAVATLMPLRARVVELGGSHAQRDVFAQILIDAAVDAGDADAALRALAERGASRRRCAWADSRRRAAESLAAAGSSAHSLPS